VFGAICSRAVRVLIIDDDMDHAESLGYLLKADGHRVETASNPLYALSLVRQFAPEVIFIDIGLPYMDGHKAGEKLRSSFKGARIYAITGKVGRGDAPEVERGRLRRPPRQARRL